MRQPDFSQLQAVLRREAPARPVLFELFMNDPLYARMTGRPLGEDTAVNRLLWMARAFAAAGYDYVTAHGSGFYFKDDHAPSKSTKSLNSDARITDWPSFEAYDWKNPADFDGSHLAAAAPLLPEGMKLMIMGPGGVLENVITLMGYDNLCYALHDEPELVEAVFNAVGARLVDYYERCVNEPSVGFLCSNDDWGFNTQTFLSPRDMRRYCFPWHERIVQVAHRAGKPCILHSCGRFDEVMEDIIAMGYDARHSYEDNIMPVEEAYERYHDRIAILGGMDVNFVMTAPVEQVTARARAMLERTRQQGGYALGTGNSVPEYLPTERYLAMCSPVFEDD